MSGPNDENMRNGGRGRAGHPDAPPPSSPAPIDGDSATLVSSQGGEAPLPREDASLEDDLQMTVAEAEATLWDAPTEAPVNIVAQVMAHATVASSDADQSDLVFSVEAPTANYQSRSIEKENDPTAAAHKTATKIRIEVPGLPPVVDDALPRAVVGKPHERVRPTKQTGMHIAMSESAAALAQVRPLVRWQLNDNLLADQLQRTILTPYGQAIATTFMAGLRDHPHAKIFLGSDADRAHMTGIIQNHLERLANNPLSDEWVSARLQVGRVHARVGLPIGIYVASVHSVERLILAYIARQQEASQQQLSEFLRRLLTFEVALVTQAHHSAQVDGLNNAMRQQAQSGFVRQYGTQIDPVTLLARPEHLRAQLRTALQEPIRDERGCAVLAIELVGLEEAAWHRGYAYRDAILSETGARVRATLRGADVAGIESTGMMLTLLSGVREKEVVIVVGRLRAAVENTAYAIQGHTFRQKLCVGVAYAVPTDTDETLIQRAIDDANGREPAG